MTKHIREIAPFGIENVSRRSVLKGMVATGGLVLAVGVSPRGPALAADAPKWGAAGMPHGTVNNPLVFVSIAPDGTVTIVCHRSEMGQGVRTGMPLIVADEIEADWAKVKVAQATGDEVKYGNQDTDGSRSTRHFIVPMRQAGAAARMMLEEAAAKSWGVDASDVEAKNHEVVQKSTGKKLGYGELAAEAAKMDVPAIDKLKLKDPSQFRYIGKEGTNIVDGFNITTGRAILWPGCPLAGAEVRRCRASAGHGGQGRLLRCDGHEEGPRRRPGHRDPRAVVPDEIPAVRGNRGHRRQHLGCDPGPQGAENYLGRRPARNL